jgi:hypothetical protein
MFGCRHCPEFLIFTAMDSLIAVFVISLALLVLAVAGLSLRILLQRKGSFPETHIGRNKEMRKRGITCAQNEKHLPGCSRCTRSDHSCPQ